ncbi:MAG: selenide, water dikinase SelD, partial [Candidatus Marinimicrobia bacterium]|nr:selenide, water dikinase SelD [Candidatus Neomarinimicrobiota bacterium]
QTSGGLLMAVSRNKADRLVAALNERGCPAADFVGTLSAKGPAPLVLRPH